MLRDNYCMYIYTIYIQALFRLWEHQRPDLYTIKELKVKLIHFFSQRIAAHKICFYSIVINF